MKFSKKASLAGFALAAVATAAMATVTFNSGSGTGFVGKGDVQLAYGWNNQAAQANAGAIQFSTLSTIQYSWDCDWDTGTGTRGFKHHSVNHGATRSITDSVSYDARTHKQVDGFFLTGYNGPAVETGDPINTCAGDSTPNGGADATVYTITNQMSMTLPGAGLYVTYAGNSVLLYTY
jgi:hypothetical protein